MKRKKRKSKGLGIWSSLVYLSKCNSFSNKL